jgi:hypothetical protein
MPARRALARAAALDISRSGSSADPSSAASSTSTNALHRSPGQDVRPSSGTTHSRDRARAQRPGEEPPGRRQVTLLGQQRVEDLAVLVDRPLQVGPPPSDLDVGLIGEPQVTRRVSAEPRRLDKSRGERLDPSVDGDVIDPGVTSR